MPYIKQEERTKFDSLIDELVYKLLGRDNLEQQGDKIVVGEVNYVISRLIWELFESNKSYTNGNNLVGAMDCAKMEFYRRRLVEYEDEKKNENGDVELKEKQ